MDATARVHRGAGRGGGVATGGARAAGRGNEFNAKDAARYPAYQAQIRRVVDVLRSLSLVAPPI